MSLPKLFLSGLLVAGGLILGAFTLHGYLDPEWAKRQALAAGARERPRDVKAINTFQRRSRFVSTRSDQPVLGDRSPPPAARTGASPGHVLKAATDTKPVARTPAKRKVAEKPKKPAPSQQQQQAFVWPWNLFGN